MTTLLTNENTFVTDMVLPEAPRQNLYSNLLADAPQENLFLAALAEIDWTLPGNLEKARQQATHALAFALPDDRQILNILVRHFTRLPYQKAREALERYEKAHPEHFQRIGACRPTTDPGLHLPEIGEPRFTRLDHAEQPRLSLRFAYRPPVVNRKPSLATTQRVDVPEAVFERAQRHARQLVLRQLDVRGSRSVHRLLESLPHSFEHTLDAHLAQLIDEGIVRRTARGHRYELTPHGRAVYAPRISPLVEPEAVTDYCRNRLFWDWEANLDKAYRDGKRWLVDRLTTERSIQRDEEAIRAARAFVRPLRQAAEVAAAERRARQEADAAWRTEQRQRRSRARTIDDAADAWDRVYLEYVTDQLNSAAVFDDPRRRQPRQRQARQANVGQLLADAHRRENTRLTRLVDDIKRDGYRTEPSYVRAESTAELTPEMTDLVSDQLGEGYRDASPMPTADDETTDRAARRTGIGISTDWRDDPAHRGDGIDVDLDKASRTPLRGWQCVSCFIERSNRDHDIVSHGRSDDGLCDDCRGDRRPGIPALPAGFTDADLVIAHCEFLARTYPAIARALLRDQWRRSGKDSPVAEVISAFMADHPGLPDPDAAKSEDVTVLRPAVSRPGRQRGPVIGAGQRRDRCRGCFEDAAVHRDHGYCTKCQVNLGLVTPTPRRRRRAA